MASSFVSAASHSVYPGWLKAIKAVFSFHLISPTLTASYANSRFVDSLRRPCVNTHSLRCKQLNYGEPTKNKMIIPPEGYVDGLWECTSHVDASPADHVSTDLQAQLAGKSIQNQNRMTVHSTLHSNAHYLCSHTNCIATCGPVASESKSWKRWTRMKSVNQRPVVTANSIYIPWKSKTILKNGWSGVV